VATPSNTVLVKTSTVNPSMLKLLALTLETGPCHSLPQLILVAVAVAVPLVVVAAVTAEP